MGFALGLEEARSAIDGLLPQCLTLESMRLFILTGTIALSAYAVAQNAAERLRTELERIHDLDQNDRHNVAASLVPRRTARSRTWHFTIH